MIKRSLLGFSFAMCIPFGMIGYGQNVSNELASNSDFIQKAQALSAQQLLDTAKYYNTDTALIFYNLIINTPIKHTDVEQQRCIIEAYKNSSVIYYSLCDYRSAYEYLVKALLLCEKYNHEAYLPKIYSNIGSIYLAYNKCDIAKSYYLKALNFWQGTMGIEQLGLLINLSAVELENQQTDSAFYYINQALQISKQNNNLYLYIILNNIASHYIKSKHYDSAFYYFRLSVEGAKKDNNIEKQAKYLSNLGQLFLMTNQVDSSFFYINLSNTLAEKYRFLRILSENYLVLSQIEEAKGRKIKSFDYYKIHTRLKDSIFNAEKFGEISQMQHLYEISKTNQQIEQLILEQQVKQRTIHYQKIVQYITFAALLSVSIVLLFVFFQKKQLNTAYKVLFQKNMEIVEFQKNSPNTEKKKHIKNPLAQNTQDEILNRILTIMEDTSVICNSNFTVDQLAKLAQSNQQYVSQVISDVFKENFRSFLNGYRIREAQQLFAEPDIANKYTIESVVHRVGFKSRSSFYEAFKKITGVSPNFYLKSLRER